MDQAIDEHLDRMSALDQADRRNGTYMRHLLTRLGEIELTTPNTTTAPPGGDKLIKVHRGADHTEDFDRYRYPSARFTRSLRAQCTPTKLRRIKRWENEYVFDKMQVRLDRMPRGGRATTDLEHPFAILKAWMGATHFLTRTPDNVRTDMSLHVLAYTSSE
jgi:hypothetical protein